MNNTAHIPAFRKNAGSTNAAMCLRVTTTQDTASECAWSIEKLDCTKGRAGQPIALRIKLHELAIYNGFECSFLFVASGFCEF